MGDLLIQSANTPGTVYSVHARGCTCPNGATGKATTADLVADAAAAHVELGRRLIAEVRRRYLAAA